MKRALFLGNSSLFCDEVAMLPVTTTFLILLLLDLGTSFWLAWRCVRGLVRLLLSVTLVAILAI